MFTLDCESESLQDCIRQTAVSLVWQLMKQFHHRRFHKSPSVLLFIFELNPTICQRRSRLPKIPHHGCANSIIFLEEAMCIVCNTHTPHDTSCNAASFDACTVTVAHTRRDFQTEKQLSACIGQGGDCYKMSAILEIACWYICHAVGYWTESKSYPKFKGHKVLSMTRR